MPWMTEKPRDDADRASTPESEPQPRFEPKPGSPAFRPREIGGPKGPEPTRYGDWEYNGRCTDF
ncbi:MAG: DUF1674 domain-containing protein [Alphaproteobacteria bacterium]|nr:DUF1674 domain-containing protein [Alphaproteobacteria bacterium]MBV9862143.1 DUF1674 domain-containing protein [Alphaproteobacteria bacterium]